MNRNELQVGLADFKLAMKRFRSYQRGKYPPRALIAFSDGMLRFEADGNVAVVPAEGEWHGHVYISARFLGALSKIPPNTDPVILRHDNGKLQIATLTFGCDWQLESAPVIKRAANPNLIDFLALERTLSRAEVLGTDLGKRINQAKSKAASAVEKSAMLLAELDITDADLWHLVETQIKARME